MTYDAPKPETAPGHREGAAAEGAKPAEGAAVEGVEAGEHAPRASEGAGEEIEVGELATAAERFAVVHSSQGAGRGRSLSPNTHRRPACPRRPFRWGGDGGGDMPKSKQRPSRPRRDEARQAFLPDDAEIEARRKALPTFPAQDAQQLLKDARTLAERERITDDEAVTKLLGDVRRMQIAKLIRALGVDANDPDVWCQAFVCLSEIHHNVGRLVHRWVPAKKNVDAPTLKQLKHSHADLVFAVSMRPSGMHEREAVRQCMEADSFRDLYQPRKHGKRAPGYPEPKDANESKKQRSGSERLKEQAFWQKYQRAKRASRSGRWSGDFEKVANRAFGGRMASNLEELLRWIEIRPGLAARGDT